MDDIKGQRIYNTTSKAFLKQHQVKERYEKLNATASFPPTEEECKEYEILDKLRMQARRKGIKRCRRIYRSNVASHPKIKKTQLTIRLIDLLIKRTEAGAKIKWRTVTNLANRVDKKYLLKLSTTQLWTERKKEKKEYYELKKQSGKLRSTLIEEKAAEQTEKGNTDEAQRLHTMLYNEKERERAARLRRISQQEARTGVRSVKKERLVWDPGGQPVLNSEGEQQTVTREITDKIELEKACMTEVASRSRLSEHLPPMRSPLVEKLEYNGLTEYGDEILLGRVSFDGVDEYTEAYLEQLRAVKGVLPEDAKPIPFPTYTSEVKKFREKTSSGPSEVTPAMIKTKATDPYLAQVGWQASNFPWTTGYSPDRFRHGLDLLIHKKPDDNRVHRLRPILLFDLEANMYNKRLGREAMSRAKEIHGVAQEQYGSRKQKAADIQALNTHLYYDYVLMEKTPATSTFIDLVSNYDLVVHSIASLAMQRVGTPKAPINCTFTTLQDMVHTVRTAYGDSIESYGGDVWAIPCSPPPQGLGQGNGAAPTIWALVSTPILNALRAKGFGAAFKCVISKKEFKLVGYCFVDDSTIVQIAPTPETGTQEIVKMAQEEIDLYAGLAMATGGQVSSDKGKNSWFLMEFSWDKHGKWKLVDNKADLFVNTKKGRIKVDRLPSSCAQRILGVWIAPDGNNRSQVEEMTKLTNRWADRVRSGYIKSADAWHYFQTTIKKSLEYPLVATTLSEEECRRIESPALKVALQCSGMPSNFSRDILYGPEEYLGLNAPRLYNTQGFKHIKALMDYGLTETVTGQQLRAIIEKHKVELGCSTSLFKTDYNQFGTCATRTWVSETWKYLDSNNLIIEESTPNLSPSRENDQFIMDTLVEAGYKGATLATLNRCRLYLQVTTLADISTGDGKQLIPQVLDGIKCSTLSKYRWPPQGNPCKPDWKIWKEAITAAFEIERNHRLPVHRRLGPWIPGSSVTGWLYSKQMDTMYELRDSKWYSCDQIITRSGRNANRKFKSSNDRSEPYIDSVPAVCIKSGRLIRSTGWTEYKKRESIDETPIDFRAAMTSGPASNCWATHDAETNDNGLYIAEAIRSGSAIAVSDGSYKNQRGSAACIIEGVTPGHNRITGTCTAPGMQQCQDAYRAELAGIYMIIKIVEKVCKLHSVDKGSITIACDGLEAIRKVMSEETSFSSMSSQYDIVSAIDTALIKSPLTWKWRHVKGHQDDLIGPLNRWASLNVECDEAAKERRRYDSVNPQPSQCDIDGEMWALKFYNGNTKAIEKVSTKLKEVFLDLIEGKKAKEYYTDHYLIQKEHIDEIDWGAIKRAREGTNFFQNRWSSRWAIEAIPSGTEMEDRGSWESAKCPRNCKEEMETPEHVVKCPKANKLWDKIKSIMFEWGRINKSRPGLMAALMDGIGQWRNEEDTPTAPKAEQPVQDAFKQQTRIGWGNALKGILTKKWAEIQQAYFREIGLRRTGVQFIAALIKKLWDISWDFWNHRNHSLACGEADVLQELLLKLHARISHHYKVGIRGLPPRCHYLFHTTPQQIQGRSTQQKALWLETVIHSRLRKLMSKDDFDPSKYPDLDLLHQLKSSGLLRTNKKKDQPPKLRTNSSNPQKQLLDIPRDTKDFEFDTVVLTPNIS